MRRVVVLRAEPDAARTKARLAAAGLEAVHLPLFAIRPVAWSPVDPAEFDALLLTSANALRHAGGDLAHYRELPVYAVGEATAQAARASGFVVCATGNSDAAAIIDVARGAGAGRLMHLAGRNRALDCPGVTAITVYAAERVAPPPGTLAAAAGSVVLLHSARAAVWFGELVDRDAVSRRTIRLAAISARVASAGGGWDGIAIADSVDDAALVALAARLARD